MTANTSVNPDGTYKIQVDGTNTTLAADLCDADLELIPKG